MNQQVRPRDLEPTTRAAEGLPRRRWSVAEIEELTRVGVFQEDERFELIGGEIVPMSPKGAHHEALKIYLNAHFMDRRPKHLMIAQETTFRMSADTFVEPDFIVYPEKAGITGISVKTVLLAVEVADSSLSYDRGRKAKLYAGFGIPELWVIDAVKLSTRVFTKPGPDGYAVQRNVASKSALVPLHAPDLAVVLARLPVRR